MKRTSFYLIVLLSFSLLLSSCVSGTDITKKNADGSPVWTSEIPKSSRVLYGVGKAKFSNDANSEDASYSNAVSDLARKISVRIDEATSLYSSEAASSLKDAYESIKITSVSLTLKGVVKEQMWKEKDGTFWTLVSVKVKDVPLFYENAASEYTKEQKDELKTIADKLNVILLELAGEKDEVSLSLKTSAEKKASSLENEINTTLSSLRAEDIRKEIETSLIKDGYILSEEE